MIEEDNLGKMDLAYSDCLRNLKIGSYSGTMSAIDDAISLIDRLNGRTMPLISFFHGLMGLANDLLNPDSDRVHTHIIRLGDNKIVSVDDLVKALPAVLSNLGRGVSKVTYTPHSPYASPVRTEYNYPNIARGTGEGDQINFQ